MAETIPDMAEGVRQGCGAVGQRSWDFIPLRICTVVWEEARQLTACLICDSLTSPTQCGTGPAATRIHGRAAKDGGQTVRATLGRLSEEDDLR